MTSSQSRVPSAALLALIVANLAALNYSWLSRDTLPPRLDAANHMRSALEYHAVLAECLRQSDLTLKQCAGALVSVDQFVYPPLFHLVGGLTVFIAGSSIAALAMANLPFLGLLVVSTYFLGRTIHGRLAGMVAAVLIVAYPLVFQMSHIFMLDFATIAMTAATVCCLVLTDRFRNKRMTLLFGVTTALGALTSFTLLTYVVGPGFYVLVRLISDLVRGRIDVRDGARRLVTLAAALAIGLAVASLWYWPHRTAFLNGVGAATSIDMIGSSGFSLRSLTYYANEMIWTQMGPPLFLLFIFGLWRFASHVAPEHCDVLLLWLVSTGLIQTAISPKAPHNDVGVLIPAALISAVAIASLNRGRDLAVTAVSGFVALQLATLTLPEAVLGSRLGTFGWTGVVTPFPRSEDWKIGDTLERVATSPARAVVATDHVFINGTTLEFYAKQGALPLDVAPCSRLRPDAETPDFSDFDIVIAKSDDGWIRFKPDGCFGGLNGRREYGALLQQLRDGSAGLFSIRSVPLPDGSSLEVFARERHDRPVAVATKPRT